MDEKERERLEHNLYIAGLCLPCMGVLFWAFWALLPPGLTGRLLIPCMFHALTGLYCPGCGGTRAAAFLIQGKIGVSFLYHPVVLYCAALYTWFMVSHTAVWMSSGRLKVGMRYRDAYLWGALWVIGINLAVKDIALAAYGVDILNSLDRMFL